MLTALLVLGAISLFTTLIAIIVMFALLIQMMRDTNTIRTLVQINTARTASTEKILIAIHTMLVQEIVRDNMAPVSTGAPSLQPDWESFGITQRDGKFVTEDGRHSADTFEELMHKISSDPRYRVARDEDIEKLRQRFEEYSDDDPDTFEGDDEEDEPNEPWQE